MTNVSHDAPLGGYIGFYLDRELPIQPGEYVVIPKGVTVKSYDPRRPTRVTTRRQLVRVNHLMNGRSVTASFRRDFEEHPDWVAFYKLVQDELLKLDENDPRRAVLRDLYYTFKVPMDNPAVCWAGSGGWWCEVDINEVLGITPQPELALNNLYDRLIAILRG